MCELYKKKKKSKNLKENFRIWKVPTNVHWSDTILKFDFGLNSPEKGTSRGGCSNLLSVK